MPFMWFKTYAYIISFLIYHIYFAYFLSFAYIVYLIYFILFLVSCSLQVSYTFMFISFHVRILCMYHIISYNLSYTVLYFYLYFYTFHIRYFCMLSLVLFMYYPFICFNTYNLHMLMQTYTFLSYHVSFQVVYIFLLVLVNIYLSLFTYIIT